MTMLLTMIAPPRHVLIIIVPLLHLLGRNWQGLHQRRMHLLIAQIIVMPQEFGQEFDIPIVVFPLPAKHGPPHVVHAEFKHALGSHLALHPQQEARGYPAVLPLDAERGVDPGPFAPSAVSVFLETSFAVRGGSHVVFSVPAFQDVDRAFLGDAGSDDFLEAVEFAREAALLFSEERCCW